MSTRVSFVAAAVVVATALVVGCEQTSSPTSPSSSASPLGDGPTSSPADATGSVVVHDPRGDSNSPAPYMDVVQAKLTEQKGKETLFFMMVLAGPIPAQPSEPDLIWPFHLNTNPATAPGGLYNEFVVRVRWFNGAFVGEVVNRIPLLTGGTPIITPVPFSIDGVTVKVFVPLQLLGNPTSFEWNAATRPGATVAYVDFAPDIGLVNWAR
jgi:hypothetical protein